MNKTVKPMINFSQVWRSQNVTSSQSKDAIAMSISILQLGRQLLGKCKDKTDFIMTVPNRRFQSSQECQQVPIW